MPVEIALTTLALSVTLTFTYGLDLRNLRRKCPVGLSCKISGVISFESYCLITDSKNSQIFKNPRWRATAIFVNR